MATIQIKYSDIPTYLHAGEFYRSLDSEDPEGIIEVPADCFHHNGLKAVDLKEFRQLLRVMVFWVLDVIPLGVMDFCIHHHVDMWGQGIRDLPDAPKQEVQPLLLTAYSKPEIIPFDGIIKTGRWDLIMHAVSRIAKSSPATRVAAKYGNLRLLQYLHEHKFEWSADVCKEAALSGHLDCLAYAHKNGCPWNREVHLAAARNGHLHCMQYAFSQRLEWHVDVCKYAALNGQLRCLQFAHENGCSWDRETTEAAARKGHVHCLMYALEHGCPVNNRACNLACQYNHLECLQLLHQFGAPWDQYAPFYAAMCPSADCLQYLHENGSPWDEETSHKAAYDGHIEPLRYAMENGCPHGDGIVESATGSDNLHCMQFLVEDQNQYMDNEVFIVALLRGNLANLQYLLDRGCPYTDAQFPDGKEDWEECDETFRNDNPEFVQCVEYAVERGWVLCDIFIRYIVTRDEPCKQWLISEGHYSEGGDVMV